MFCSYHHIPLHIHVRLPWLSPLVYCGQKIRTPRCPNGDEDHGVRNFAELRLLWVPWQMFLDPIVIPGCLCCWLVVMYYRYNIIYHCISLYIMVHMYIYIYIYTHHGIYIHIRIIYIHIYIYNDIDHYIYINIIMCVYIYMILIATTRTVIILVDDNPCNNNTIYEYHYRLSRCPGECACACHGSGMRRCHVKLRNVEGIKNSAGVGRCPN